LTKSIIISNSDVKVLIEHAKSEDPKESCALLIGSETDEEWNVKEVFLTENMDDSKINFTISPEEELKVDTVARKKDMEIVCIFHSHPDSDAIPSGTDKKFMSVNPFPWIIYSCETDEMNCFVLKNKSLEQISIKES
jgi:proteasome lid subunit RPN8/RPN11